MVSAPSGSGKTTLVKALLAQDLPLAFSISATSRAPRGEEVDGVDYHFLSASQFKDYIDSDAFIEYEEVYPNKFYGTFKSDVKRNREAGKHVVFDIDVVGGLNIKKQYPDQTLSIFIKPPGEAVLEKRLRARGTESETALQERLAKANEELKSEHKFDRLIVNDDLDKSKQQIIEMVKQFIES